MRNLLLAPIAFSFFLPAEDGRQPSELMQMFTENAHMIASVAVQRWLNPTKTIKITF